MTQKFIWFCRKQQPRLRGLALKSRGREVVAGFFFSFSCSLYYGWTKILSRHYGNKVFRAAALCKPSPTLMALGAFFPVAAGVKGEMWKGPRQNSLHQYSIAICTARLALKKHFPAIRKIHYFLYFFCILHVQRTCAQTNCTENPPFVMSVRVVAPFFLSLEGCKPELNKLFSGNLPRAFVN